MGWVCANAGEYDDVRIRGAILVSSLVYEVGIFVGIALHPLCFNVEHISVTRCLFSDTKAKISLEPTLACFSQIGSGCADKEHVVLVKKSVASCS